jgi:hypothetical protein
MLERAAETGTEIILIEDGCNRKGSTMSVYKRRGKWFCDITIDGRRVQRVLKKSHTRAQAIKATTVIENKVFENRYQIEKKAGNTL